MLINVHNTKFGICIEDVIHNALEFRICIFQSKRHDIPSLLAERNCKCSFVSIPRINLDLPKSGFHIKFGKYKCRM